MRTTIASRFESMKASRLSCAEVEVAGGVLQRRRFDGIGVLAGVGHLHDLGVRGYPDAQVLARVRGHLRLEQGLLHVVRDDVGGDYLGFGLQVGEIAALRVRGVGIAVEGLHEDGGRCAVTRRQQSRHDDAEEDSDHRAQRNEDTVRVERGANVQTRSLRCW